MPTMTEIPIRRHEIQPVTFDLDAYEPYKEARQKMADIKAEIARAEDELSQARIGHETAIRREGDACLLDKQAYRDARAETEEAERLMRGAERRLEMLRDASKKHGEVLKLARLVAADEVRKTVRKTQEVAVIKIATALRLLAAGNAEEFAIRDAWSEALSRDLEEIPFGNPQGGIRPMGGPNVGFETDVDSVTWRYIKEAREYMYNV